MSNIIITEVAADDSEIRLDRWFKRHYPQVPFGTVAKLCRKGNIRLDGKRVKPEARLLVGQKVKFPKALLDIVPVDKGQEPTQARKDNLEKKAEEFMENIIYQDKNILVINKPAGIAVQGGTKIAYSVDDFLEFYRFDKNDRPRLVHRLDKDTSGILLIARSAKTAADLAELIRQKRVEKKYLALLDGVPKVKQGLIDIELQKSEDEDGDEKVRSQANGKKARTEYRILDYANQTACLGEFNLITGRTHQIRVHTAEIGCPIMGDKKYNHKRSKYKHMMLHAWEMSFMLNGQRYDLRQDPPEHFIEAMEDYGLRLAK
jgi:23S rRNA pseudouridine955/2504/2580 synthase